MTKRGHTSSDFSYEFENTLVPTIHLNQNYEEEIPDEPMDETNNDSNEEYVELEEVPDPEIENPVAQNRKLSYNVIRFHD